MKVSRLTEIVVALVLAAAFAFPSSDISKALERLANGSADQETVALLKSALEVDPSAPAWWAWLGYAHCLRGEWDEAQKAYQWARELKAAPSFPWFPPTLPTPWLGKHGAAPILTTNGLTVWQSPPVFCEPNFASDPKHGDKFSRIVFVYSSKEGEEAARCLVHWMSQTGDLPKHIADAPSVFAAALKLFSERFGTSPKLPVKAWLFPRGNGSAFSFAGHTLFYGTVPDDRWSWWLKVVHEAGHHAVPAFGEFDGLHEPYSGGFLGERLFALWVWDEGMVARGDSELNQKLSEYLRKVVSAEIVRAQQWLLQTSDESKPAMQVFLGLCLFLERLGGYQLLREVMANSTDDTWGGFKNGLERALTERLRNGLKIRLFIPDANTPLSTFDIAALREGLKAPSVQLAWWLPAGNFQCEVEVQGEGVLQVRWGESGVGEWSVRGGGQQKFSCVFTNASSGWQRLRFWWLKGGGKILSVTFRQKG